MALNFMKQEKNLQLLTYRRPKHLFSTQQGFTWTRDEAGLLHLLEELLPHGVSTELRLHWLGRGLVQVPPVDDT